MSTNNPSPTIISVSYCLTCLFLLFNAVSGQNREDDVVVFADTVSNYLERLGQVWDRCRKAGLKLKPRKCQLLRSSVAFLGLVIDADGVHTDPDKVRRIQEWPVPRNLHHVRSFVGLTSYYRRFIQDYAKKAEPLHRLTKKDVPFEGTDETEAAFQSLKEALIEPVMLAYPQVDGGMFVLDTDASGTAIGAVLSQVQDGEERVLAYGSRCLSSMERNYCTTRWELLAVVHFIEYYRHYLLGRKVLVRTDHGSLRWLRI